VLAANCKKCPAPSYPDLARKARIEDVVVLSATIGKDGLVKEIKVIRGNPLLKDEAVNTVKGWEYRPHLLNGDPVEVTATITINFKLK
jgi:TonB family protein